MSGVAFNAVIEDLSLAASTDKTALQLLAASNHRVLVRKISIAGKSNTAGDTPVHFQILTQTSAGTASALTLQKVNAGDDETLQTTAQKTFSAEPTDSGAVKKSINVHPQSRAEIVFPPGRELVIQGGARLGIKTISPAQTSVFTFDVECEE
jgi:hypothetical protein